VKIRANSWLISTELSLTGFQDNSAIMAHRKTQKGTGNQGTGVQNPALCPLTTAFLVPLWGIVGATVVYCLCFLAVRFEPLEMLPDAPPFFRGSFFLLLLTPEIFKTPWFGDRITFSLAEAWPIFKVALFFPGAAYGYGCGILGLLRLKKFWTFCEHFVFANALGLSFLSTLLMGLLWPAIPVRADYVAMPGFVIAALVVFFHLAFWGRNRIFRCFDPKKMKSFRASAKTLSGDDKSGNDKWPLVCLFVLAIPSLLILFFGGILPPVEYDVTSYHLPGARQFFEMRRIGFVPNNVYVNMPFGAEMFYVWGMLLADDWYKGALVGKLVIAYCTFLTALGLYAFACRLHSKHAGMIAFLLYVSLPWVSWTSTAGLIDSVFGMYLLLALFAMYFYSKSHPNTALLFLSGLMAGSAAACKYTAVPFLVLPLTVWCAFICWKKTHSAQKVAGLVACFVLGIILSCGLWYAKNYLETGNPTYPLLYRLFGDDTGTWDAVKNERWTRVHSSHDFSAAAFFNDFNRFFLTSPWSAPVIIPLAIFPFLRRKQDKTLLVLLLYLLFYLICWWFQTHRLDRFWVPLLPVLVLFAGLGATIRTDRIWTIFITIILIFNTFYTFFPNSISAPGKYSRFGFGVEAARLDPERVKPFVLYFNAHPPTGKLLLIGDADVFDYDIPVLYNTCFDNTVFDEIVTEIIHNPKNGTYQTVMRSPEEMRRQLHERGISTVLVNWSEIERFRSSGNYGYTSNLVQPELFGQLVRDGVLKRQNEISTDLQQVFVVLP